MKSFRKLAALAVFAIGSLTALSSTASAQSGNGSFTLSHEVVWQNTVVPAGTYKFSLEPKGPAAMLTLRNISGGRGGFLILVTDVRSSKFADANRLVMVSRAGKSFVRTLDLPQFETILHFTVPSEGAEKELALASDTSVPTHLR
jgi:hypothetical protein